MNEVIQMKEVIYMNEQQLAPYKRHMDICAQRMQESPIVFKRALLFVLATIQQQLEIVPTILETFESSGQDSPFAFGSKKKGVEYVHKYADTMYEQARELLFMEAEQAEYELMRLFLRVPGLGLVKAGFAVQLFCGMAGCLDTHNLTLYGVPLSTVRMDKRAPQHLQDRRIYQYLRLCGDVGGAVFLWGAWCEYKAGLRPQNWPEGGGLEVSQLHVDCVCGNTDGQYNPYDYDGVDFEPRFRREERPE